MWYTPGMQLTKKISIIFICFVYLFSYVVHNFIIGTRAETTLKSTNIVAVFVDKDIYDDIQDDIQRYTRNYIQQRISNSKATVFPINTDTFKAKDVVKILENIYFDGLKGETSKLVGTILIGDIPLPVVNHDNFVFPSIYPYVDFEDQQYIYNASTEFFEYNINPDAQADIWHGIINFKDDLTAYNDYFAKLTNYANNPWWFVDAKIRYDDFTALKKYFIDGNLQYYTNKHLFAEDTAYKRFSTFFLNVLQWNRNQDIAWLGAKLSNDMASALDTEAEYSDDNVLAYNAGLTAYGDTMNDLFSNNSSALTNASDTPTFTLFLENIIPEFLRGYTTLFGNIYSETMRDNIFAWWRWISNDQIDTHIKKVGTKDDIMFRDIATDITPTIKDFNDTLEETLNNQITQEQYAMRIPIPLTYQYKKRTCGVLECGDEIDNYEFFFFGKKALHINSLAETSIYRGTYQNLNTTDGLALTTDVRQSVGWTFDIFSQQTEANRWYNFSATSEEIDYRNNTKIQWRWESECTDSLLLGLICIARSWEPMEDNGTCVNIMSGDDVYQWTGTETPLDFAIRKRGWASPINLIPDPNNSNDQILKIPSWFPYFKHAIEPIYDIAWSKAVSNHITNTNTIASIENFGSAILTSDQAGNVEFPRCINDIDMDIFNNGFRPKNTVPYNMVNFSNAFALTVWHIQIANPSVIVLDRPQSVSGIGSAVSRRWLFKTIDTVFYHTSPTPNQVNNMNLTTRDRPIDNTRKVSFVGVWWETIDLPYPNIYATPVYTESWSILILMEPDDIAASIKEHLQSYVQDYNETLATQLNSRMNYYNTNPVIFNFLSQHNTAATPNRTYALIDEDIFVNALGENTIQEIARLLHYQNIPRQEKLVQDNINDTMQHHYDTIDINQKISHVMDNYLVSDNEQSPLFNPWYVANGYEVAFINSDGIHTIDNGSVPSFIRDIQASQNDFSQQRKPRASSSYDQRRADEDREQQECGYDPLSPVPLVQRPGAVACWAKQLAQKPFWLTMTIPSYNSFGSELADQFSNYGDDMSDYAKQRTTAVQLEQANDTVIGNLPASQQQNLQDIMQYTITRSNMSAWYVDPDLDQEKYLQIVGTRNLGNVQVTVSATGDNCLIVDGESNNLCNNPVSLSRNFFNNNTRLPIRLGDSNYSHSTKAWLTTVIFRICSTQNTQACIHKTQQINILPGSIASLEITAPNSVIRSDRIPVIVSWRDVFNNELWIWLDEFVITASTGSLFDSNTTDTSLSFTDFNKAQFLYNAPGGVTHNTVAQLFVSLGDGSDGPIAAKEILIKTPVLDVDTTVIDYTLPTTIDGIKTTTAEGIEHIDLDAIPSMTLSLTDVDGVDLMSYIQVTSSKNLLQPSISETRSIFVDEDEVMQTILKPQSSFFLEDGNITIYFEPTYQAWEDILTITAPGLEPVQIPVTINPGEARRVIMENIPAFGAPWESFDRRIAIYDIWWNPVQEAVNIEVWSIGSLLINGTKSSIVTVTDGVAQITITTDEPWGISYAYARIDGLALSEHIPGYARIAIQRDVVPREDLNVMYLNMFGNDRWNQWWYFSDINASYINDRIQNSDKLLTTTTQLINPDKIKEVAFIVTPSLKIKNLDSNTVSLLSDTANGLSLVVNDLADIRIGDVGDFSLQQINTINNFSPSTTQGNTISYIPESTDSFIMSNSVQWSTIQINNNTVFDLATLDSSLSIQLSSEQHHWYPLWNVHYNNILVWRMIIQRTDQTLLNQAASRTHIYDIDTMSMHIIFAEGSTNGEQWIALTKNFWFFSQDNSYTSIEDSNDENLTIGFRGPFKNISNFAAWQHIWDATKWFASLFAINIGDPLVTRMDMNKKAADTPFDTSMGTNIYNDPGKTIFEVVPFDFNNDGLDDLLVAHTDGSVKLLKNYGWTDPYKDTQNILLIADTIKDIFVGDVNNNNYNDIIIQTNTNQLRVYYNNEGIFDVDGRMVCLDVPWWPASLDWVVQLFVEDMDLDGNIDIITHDREWAIKIFYGWTTDGGSNYVSELAYTCDDGWQERQEDNVVLVKQYGVELDPEMKILDGSLVHRDGLAMPPEDDQNNPLGDEVSELWWNDTDAAMQALANMYENEFIDTDTFQANMAALMQSQWPLNAMNNLDIDALIQAGWEQLLRHTPNPFSIIPSYETLPSNEIAYISLGYLTSDDPVRVYKTYEDLNGWMLLEDEEVLITVHIEANENTTITFADQIRGPWIIPQHSDWSLGDFDYGTIPEDAAIIRNTENDGFSYILDNVTVQAGETISFSYIVQYIWGSPMIIDVTNKAKDWVNDDYPDIVVTPGDSCAKFSWTFYNDGDAGQWYRTYNETFENLWEEINNYYENLQNNLGDNLDTVSNVVGDVWNGMNSDFIDSMMNQWWNPQSILDNFTVWNPINLNAAVNMTIVDGTLNDVSEAFDTALQWLCQWFKLWWGNPCIQPPVPFNMSFLSPGTFNIFGCTLFQDKWLPLFFFPGTVYVAWAPVPMPYGLTQPGTDSFYWAPGWTLPSMIRIYISPTLTAQLWIAICLWPQGATQAIPQPIRDLGGNCIVMSLAIPCGSPSPEVGPNEVYTQQLDPRWVDAGQAGTCTQPSIAYTETTVVDGVSINSDYASSPFIPVAQDPFVPYPTPVIPQNTYGFGLIDFKADPVFVDADMPDFEDFVENIKLRAGEKVNLKILGGKAMGLVKCVIQDWMDRQVKYIINNMSQMTIGVYFPDAGQIVEGLGSLNAERLEAIFSQEASLQEINTSVPEWVDISWLDKISNRAQNNLLQQWDLANLSAELSNPFELVGQMFEQVNLVNIASKDVIVPIPFIYAEDVIRYASYLETWIEANGGIRDEWKNITKSALGVCSNTVVNDVNQTQWNAAQNTVAQRKQATTVALNQAIAANDASLIQQKRNELRQLEDCDTFTQNARFQQFLNIEENYHLLVRDIKQNLKVLEQYQQFPIQLYEWMHVTDRYLTELSGFIGGFFGKISYWLGTNAKRFSQYVDAIITLIGVIRTWQALIDLSVNRAENCGTCSNDTYDYYSCSLAFLCPQLPILPIPPFKLPNIYLDMSRINIGMQILLPSFKFVPTSIALPRIPDLPRPPVLSLGVNLDFSPFNIPNLPILPRPPQLPTLPTLLPQVELDLPVLPPAPKIPAISPSISATINAAEFIGKIMCIIKWQGIGLVAENGVKSKIEQMTQRSWNVPFFDYLDMTTTFRDPPMQWFDYQIDTFINLQFNFNGVYDTINYMANRVSENVTKPFERLESADTSLNTLIEDGNQFLHNNPVNNIINNIQNNINIDINIDPDNLLNRDDIDIPEVAHTTVKKELLGWLQLLDDYSLSNTYKQEIQSIDHILRMDHAIVAHLEQLDQIHQEVQSVIYEKQQEVQAIKEQIQVDYDGFLDDIYERNTILVADDKKEYSRSMALFGANKGTKDLLNTSEHPLLTYLNLQEEVAYWYQNALASSNPASLGIHPTQHQHMSRYFAQVSDTIHQGKQLLAGTARANTTHTTLANNTRNNSINQSSQRLSSNTNGSTQKEIPTASLPLIAQTSSNDSSTCVNCGWVTNTASADLTQYAKWIRVEWDNGQIINVVASEDHIDAIGNNYTLYDINDDGEDDIIMRDSNSIYIKYAEQNTITNSDQTSYNSQYYVSPVLNDPADLDNLTDNNGYITVSAQWGFLSFTNNISLKIYDKDREVKNFRMQWQSFDSISFSWSNSMVMWDNPDGYLVQLNHRVDTHHDKYHPLTFMSNALIDRVYALVLPVGTTLENPDRFVRPYNNNPGVIQNLMGNEIVDIFYYDPDEEDISITLVDLSRHWKYAQVSTLYDRGNENVSIYERASPWSNQIVVGTQLLDDAVWPVPTVEFVRVQTDEIISTGTEHAWYVSTDYRLDITREDNVAVAYNWIEDNEGNIIATYTGDVATIDGLFFTGAVSQVITIGAMDYNDNFNRTTISLSIAIPTIEIDSVYREWEDAGSIVATISNDMDEWLVSFERMRTTVRETLSAEQDNSSISQFPLDIGQTVVTGSVFDLSDDIWLYNTAGETIALLDPSNGTITIDPNFANQYILDLDFDSHVPMIRVIDTLAWQQIFQIYYAASSLYGSDPIQLLSPSISLEQLWPWFDSFANGWCVKDDNSCLSYISPQWHIYVPTPYHTSLKGEVLFNGDYITYIVKNTQGDTLYSVNLVIQPIGQ